MTAILGSLAAEVGAVARQIRQIEGALLAGDIAAMQPLDLALQHLDDIGAYLDRLGDGATPDDAGRVLKLQTMRAALLGHAAPAPMTTLVFD